MAPADVNSSESYWISLIPAPVAGRLILIASLLLPVFFLVRFALSSRTIGFMKKELEDTTSLYYKAVDHHILDLEVESHCTITKQFLDLDSQATKLRIKTLNLQTPLILWWWNEFVAFFNGHCFAILKCTWQIKILKKEIELVIEDSAHNLNTSTVEVSPRKQLWLRRQRALSGT
ncbi:hypothetical protein C8R44DRAFT_748324 [Mycena epipterygia]|nr:hypothetical protein C8R44DRAFT_748324 [Mycena epipterygia]